MIAVAVINYISVFHCKACDIRKKKEVYFLVDIRTQTQPLKETALTSEFIRIMYKQIRTHAHPYH